MVSREDIELEIKEHARKRKIMEDNDRVYSYLGNFHGYLSNSYQRQNLAHVLDRNIGEFHDDCIRGVTGKCDPDMSSQKKRALTYREFFQEVDSATEEAGLNNENLVEIIERMRRREISADQFAEKILPIYMNLRSRGFNRNDLI